jgi:hypothetical protein
LQNSKRAVFRVWQSVDGSCKDPLRDRVLGTAAVDLTALLFGIPWVSGWFNIVDFTGRCNGQIKVCIHILAGNQLLFFVLLLITTYACSLSGVWKGMYVLWGFTPVPLLESLTGKQDDNGTWVGIK